MASTISPVCMLPSSNQAEKKKKVASTFILFPVSPPKFWEALRLDWHTDWTCPTLKKIMLALEMLWDALFGSWVSCFIGFVGTSHGLRVKERETELQMKIRAAAKIKQVNARH